MRPLTLRITYQSLCQTSLPSVRNVPGGILEVDTEIRANNKRSRRRDLDGCQNKHDVNFNFAYVGGRGQKSDIMLPMKPQSTPWG